VVTQQTPVEEPILASWHAAVAAAYDDGEYPPKRVVAATALGMITMGANMYAKVYAESSGCRCPE